MSSVLAYIPRPPGGRVGFHVGPLYFHFYGLAIAIGVLLAFWLARRRWRQTGHDPAEIEVPGIWAVVAGFIGGRVAYVSTHSGEFRGHWLHVFAIWEGGLALYGGLTLGILTGIFVAWRRGLPVLETLDAAIPAIPLAQAFGRWGNYFNQELFGTPTKVPWALEVDRAHRPARYVDFATFHPTFLYESLWDLLIVGTLVWLGARRKLRTGSIVLCYLERRRPAAGAGAGPGGDTGREPATVAATGAAGQAATSAAAPAAPPGAQATAEEPGEPSAEVPEVPDDPGERSEDSGPEV